MKRTILLTLTLLVLLMSIFALASCNSAKTFDVIYMVDGVQYSKLTTSGNRVFPLPPEPTKEGYEFKGWYYDADYFLEPYDNTAWESTPLLNNITVYAKWRKEGACPDNTCIPGAFVLVKEPTCTDVGVEEAICEECGESVYRTLEKIPHTASNERVIENVVPATCDKQGSYEEIVVCSECGEEMERTVCYTEKEKHIPKASVWEKIHDSTCTEEGSYEEVVYCRDCSTELSREERVIESKPHSEDTNICQMCKEDFLIYEYSEELDGYIVTGAAENTYTSIVIPSRHEGKAVRAIAEGAFRDFSRLTKIEIPFNVTVIEANAFAGCTALASITYHGKLTEWQAITVGEGNDLLLAITPYCTNNFTDWMPF